MNISLLRKPLTAAILFVLSCSTSALATANISISPSGSSSYIIQGNGMDGVAGIQIDVTYDATSLSTPSVTQGVIVAGAMLAANTTQPGIVRIAIVSTRTFSGSGQIATISFASKKGNGGITSFKTSMINSNGSPFDAVASNGSPFDAVANNVTTETSTTGATSSGNANDHQTQQQETSPNTTSTGLSGNTSATIPTYLGSVSMPPDQQKQVDQQPALTTTATTSEKTAEVRTSDQTKPVVNVPAEAKTGETPQYTVYKGVIERFKSAPANKRLSDVTALFDKKIAQNIYQDPAILLSNGKNKAFITIDFPASAKFSPSFAVNGGKLISFKRDKQLRGRWIIEVLPETGILKTTLSIIAGVEQLEFPLTVAPPIKTELTLDERGWKQFSKEIGSKKAPQHDFNIDGKRDYQDEYIFIANYLVKKTPKASTANK